MDINFWHQRWQSNSIDFHKNEANPLLVSYFNRLSLARADRVFIPLCGKTQDIGWLLANGHRVAGVELSELAVRQLFTGLGIDPEISCIGKLRRYSAKDIDIFVGNIFALTYCVLGPVDAVFDRAALVALPADMRIQYTRHLAEISESAPQLLITYEYDQDQMQGPPFSVDAREIYRHYQKSYEILHLVNFDVAGGLKGICAAKEYLWHLKDREKQKLKFSQPVQG